MRMLVWFAAILTLPQPAWGAWKATTPQAEAAAKDPLIAEVLAATAAMDAAILAKDAEGFAAAFSDKTVVNSPYNNVARMAEARSRLARGLIDYTSLERHIEFAEKRTNGEVILMGEEHLSPVGASAAAGKRVRRRTTELWSKESGRWKLVLRQATIYDAK